MQVGRRLRVHAGSGTPAGDPNNGLFTAALAQNAGLTARVKLPEGIGANGAGMSLIKGIQVSSFDQCDWEFWFWANSLFQTGDAREAFRGYWSFTVAGGDGKRIGATGLYYYYVDGLEIFYEDDDGATRAGAQGIATSNQQQGAYLNVELVNRSAGGKTAAAWFDVIFIMEPTLGY
jgi:hypothetical protein